MAANRRAFCKFIWRSWSPTWAFDDATYDRTVASFDNPDFVEVVIHSYRCRYGYAPGDPSLDAIEHSGLPRAMAGSVARGDAIEESDIDLLVRMADPPRGLAYFGRFGDLQRALEALLGRHVDVMDVEALRRMRERVLAEAVPL